MHSVGLPSLQLPLIEFINGFISASPLLGGPLVETREMGCELLGACLMTYRSLSSARHAVEGFAAIFCAPSVSLAALGGHAWSNILVVFSGLKLICCFYIWLSLN